MDQWKTLLVRIFGRVQGVNYRAWAQDEARELGLAGWVRNEPDGSVRALVAGPPPAVEAMLDRLRAGPPAAAVDRVDAEPAAESDVPAGFEVRY